MTNETKPITEEVQMSLAEASDLFDKAWYTRLDQNGRPITYGPDYNKPAKVNFINNFYQFKPYSLSDLAKALSSLKKETLASHYSSGRVYAARKIKNGVEIRPVKWIHRDYWNKGSPMNEFLNGNILTDNGKSQIAVYEIFSNQDYLNLEKAAESWDWDTIKISGEKTTLAEISNLSIWEDKMDYETFLRNIYGAEEIENYLRGGQKFYVTDPHNPLSDKWSLVTTALTLGRWCIDDIPIFRGLKPTKKSEDISKFGLIGKVNVPTSWEYGGASLEGCLLKDYAKPQFLENGIVLLNQDRIPLYIKRKLGLGRTQ
jgi:hypothetical protein